jgi:hypothetical protein
MASSKGNVFADLVGKCFMHLNMSGMQLQRQPSGKLWMSWLFHLQLENIAPPSFLNIVPLEILRDPWIQVLIRCEKGMDRLSRSQCDEPSSALGNEPLLREDGMQEAI